MGGLHKGHSKLIKTAKETNTAQNPVVLVSVFINPLQFGPQEDFSTYPRDFEGDCHLAAKSGASAIWFPAMEDVFPGGPESHIQLHAPNNLKSHLCGIKRNSHFDGVVTVMSRLIALVKPQLIVLGEKDWQQLIILRHLVTNLGLSVNIKGVATVRDKDGLACSSRNASLKPSEREKALALPRLLKEAAKKTLKGELVNLSKIRYDLKHKGLDVEYLEIVDPFLLHPVKASKNLCLLAGAIQCESTRLIDHTFLMTRKPIVAIDGPAGAGKSTVTKCLAKKLNLLYLDTGAMYRALTWLIKTNGIDYQDESSIRKIVSDFHLEFKTSNSREQQVLVNNHDVTQEIRSPEITDLVSKISSLSLVRHTLTKQQRDMGRLGGIIAEGRDVGSCVFPDAGVKFFLTASPSERAKRRASDLKNRGYNVPNINELEAQIKERDMLDSTREISPLIKAKDAIEVITDGMDIEEVINYLSNIFYTRIPNEAWPCDQE